MHFLDYFRAPSKTAALAKERLQIIVAHERSQRDGHNQPLDYLPMLQRELLDVIRKYVVVEDEHIKIHLEKEGDYERLEVNITLPEGTHRQQKND